jgi:hypothetical protein
VVVDVPAAGGAAAAERLAAALCADPLLRRPHALARLDSAGAVAAVAHIAALAHAVLSAPAPATAPAAGGALVPVALAAAADPAGLAAALWARRMGPQAHLAMVAASRGRTTRG